MASLKYLYIDSVDCKSACINFKIDKVLNGINVFAGTFAKTPLDTLKTVALEHAVVVWVTPSGASDVAEFYGAVTRIDPYGKTYEIEAMQMSRLLAQTTHNIEYTSSTLETVSEAISESGTGLTWSNISGTTSSITLTDFITNNQDKWTLLRNLTDMSVFSTNPPWVHFMTGRDNTTLCYDRYGRSATGITLVVGTDIVEPMVWKKTTDEIKNAITILYSGGIYYESDSASITSYGKHEALIHRYDVNNGTDAALIKTKYLYDYKDPRELIWARVKYDSLVSTNVVLNQTYTLTDATASKTAQGPYTCIRHIIHWPGFLDECWFGSIYQDLASYSKSLERRIQTVERTRPLLFPSTTVRHSFDSEANTSATSYTKLKTITLTNGLPGGYTIHFELKQASATGYSVYGKIYKDGAAWGTEQSTALTSYVNMDQNFTESLTAGTTVELWGKKDASATNCYVQNFRIQYDFSAVRPYAYTTT